MTKETDMTALTPDLTAAPEKRPNFFVRLLAPIVQHRAFMASYEAMSLMSESQLAARGIKRLDMVNLAWNDGEDARRAWLGE